MSYKLGKRSLSNLEGVHPDLIKVVKRAIELTECDFTVIEGLRTKQRQAQLLKEKKTTTMNSRHLTGHAVDLAAWVNCSLDWNFDHYFKIADAMRKAAIQFGIKLRWGGAWRFLNDFNDSKTAYNDYIAERKKLSQKPFLDGVHFEIDQ